MPASVPTQRAPLTSTSTTAKAVAQLTGATLHLNTALDLLGALVDPDAPHNGDLPVRPDDRLTPEDIHHLVTHAAQTLKLAGAFLGALRAVAAAGAPPGTTVYAHQGEVLTHELLGHRQFAVTQVMLRDAVEALNTAAEHTGQLRSR